jgi:hypothetical protein
MIDNPKTQPKCECGANLRPTNLRFKSDVGSTDVYQLQDLYCPNPRCPNYFGGDANNPKIIDTVRNKVGE